MPAQTMTSQREDIAYFDDLSRRNRRTWVVSGIAAVGFNLMLLIGMPYLMDRGDSKERIDTLITDIHVIRMKRPETPVKRKEVKPPPLPKKLNEKPNATPKQMIQPKLTLPFEINPRLPGGLNSLKVPDLSSAPLIHSHLSDLFSEGQLDAPLTVLVRIPPVYPLRARNRGIEGWVKVSFVVDDTGHVTNILILKSEPAEIFDQSVIRCVGGWRFKPGTIDGMKVKVKVETTIRFELE
jgi:periplasmic protein TonB